MPPQNTHFGIVIVLNESYLKGQGKKDTDTSCPTESKKCISHVKGTFLPGR